MVQKELESLEVRVKKMIGVVKQLKDEKIHLKGQLKDLDDKLIKREKEFIRFGFERKRVRAKLEKLLGELSQIK